MKTFIASNYQRIKGFYARYERALMTLSLVGGFLVDFLAFVNIDIVFKFTVLVIYWVAAGGAIAFMQMYDAGKVSKRFEWARLFMPLVVQWTFGGLLNISLIFYWFSGAFSISWPLLFILVALLVFNDSFRQHFSKPLVQISVYFFTTFSLFSLILPFIFASLSPWLFVVAGAASVILFAIYIYSLSVYTQRPQAQTRQLFTSILIIAGIMNVLYFTNIIPPIPLALREAGLYHSLTVKNGQYLMQAEPEDFLQNIQDAIFGQTVHVVPGEKIYLYTAIFAPANLTTTIVHRWQYYDLSQKKWIDKGNLQFTINGGRQDGYKGYSWQSNLQSGAWRVYVQNQRGQVLAKVRFSVIKTATPVQLQEVTR